jgi:tetratricopeptide (TPR) repeat protein
VPSTIYSLIESRLARLSDPARRVLDAAVAAGREFEFEVAARAAALSEEAALDALDELRAAGLIQPLGLGQQRFEFDHSLTMEVAYREVGEPRHRLLHRRVAEALETAHRNRLDEFAGVIASHFAEGNAPERAAPYALRAAKQAERLAAWKEAVGFYELALAGSNEREKAVISLALGEARLRAGELAQATEAFRAAIDWVNSQRGISSEEARRWVGQAQFGLGQSLVSQARYAEAVQLAQDILAGCPPDEAVRAELLWGTALSVEGADLADAAEHLNAAARLLQDRPDPALLAHIQFELGSVAAQQGDLERAVALYRESLATIESVETPDTPPRRILAYNNLAYHLHLLNDPAAVGYAETGLRLAQESGSLGLQTYLLSTLGEIALARDDLDAADRHFSAGLSLAESFAAQERIAGLTANRGLVAHRRGETALAIHRLSTALARADAIGTRHLAAQIRLWLAPLLPPAEARARLAEARAFAESSGRRRLLEEAVGLERQLSSIPA